MDRRQFLKLGLAAIVLASSSDIIAEEKPDTKILEYMINDYKIPVQDNFVENYDPKKDYEKNYKEIVRNIADLEKVKYEREHALAEAKFKVGKISVAFSRDPSDKNLNLLIYMEEDWFEVSYFRNKKSYSFKPNLYSKNETNQGFYLANSLAKLVYDCIKKESLDWKNRPWLEPSFIPKKKSDSKAPDTFDQKTGELLYYGEDWCEPCQKIAEFLLYNKIKFRELSASRSRLPYEVKIPTMFYEGHPVIGGRDILHKIKEIYQIQ